MNTKANIQKQAVNYRTTFTIKSKFRLTLFIVIVLTLITCAISFFALTGKAQVLPDHYLNRTVSQGDTLWAIARESVPRGQDIRDYITEIYEWNQLTSANIKVGQRLQIPIYESKARTQENTATFGCLD